MLLLTIFSNFVKKMELHPSKFGLFISSKGLNTLFGL